MLEYNNPLELEKINKKKQSVYKYMQSKLY